MNNEKFPKEKTPEETLKEAMNDLDDANFKFACFVSNFKRYVEKGSKEMIEKTIEEKISKFEKKREKEIK